MNKVDSAGNNVFEGGFLGLDNITVVDRSEKLPDGAVLEQSDGTGWMGFFCLYMMRIALELANENPTYEGLATKFFQHYIYIGAAMKKMGGRAYQLWDEQDGFFYDILRYPNGDFHKFRVRSLVGLIPLFAVEVLYDEDLGTSRVSCATSTGSSRTGPSWSDNACYAATIGGARAHILSIVDRDQFAAYFGAAEEPGRVSVGLRNSQPFEVSSRTSVLISATGACATNRPRKRSSSRAGIRTGAGRSGSRPAICWSRAC